MWLRSWQLGQGTEKPIADVSNESLMDDFEGWLLPFLSGARTKGQLQAVDVNSAIRYSAARNNGIALLRLPLADLKPLT